MKNQFHVGDIVMVEGNFGSTGPHVIIHIGSTAEPFNADLCYALNHQGQPFMFHSQEAHYADLFGISPDFLKKWTPNACRLARLLFL